MIIEFAVPLFDFALYGTYDTCWNSNVFVSIFYFYNLENNIGNENDITLLFLFFLNLRHHCRRYPQQSWSAYQV